MNPLWKLLLALVAAVAVGLTVMSVMAPDDPPMGDVAVSDITPRSDQVEVRQWSWCHPSVPGYTVTARFLGPPDELIAEFDARWGPVHEGASARTYARVYESVTLRVGAQAGGRTDYRVDTYDMVGNGCPYDFADLWGSREAWSFLDACRNTVVSFRGVFYGSHPDAVERVEPPPSWSVVEFAESRAVAHDASDLDVIYARTSDMPWTRLERSMICGDG